MTDTRTTDPRVSGRPVKSFDMEYEWFGGDWERLFDEQIALVRSDIRRAKAEGRLVIYLSCPISARGGGYSGTNVDVARFVERRLLTSWGEGVWILNPAQYQMESPAGTGLMNRHADRLGIDLEALIARTGGPKGGDYMRMWTKVLVENPLQVGHRTLPDTLVDSGQYFDGYYFIGPSDVQAMFLSAGESLTTGIQEYFSRKFDQDPDFCDAFSFRDLRWGARDPATPIDPGEVEHRARWQLQRSDFFRFYALRAGANYSLGCHDEWLIYQQLNAVRRREAGIAEQISGFFDGRQIDPPSTEAPVTRGYSRAGTGA